MTTDEQLAQSAKRGCTAPPALLGIDQACVVLGRVGKDRIYRWVRAGLLEAVRDGGRTFIVAQSAYTLHERLTPYKSGEEGSDG